VHVLCVLPAARFCSIRKHSTSFGSFTLDIALLLPLNKPRVPKHTNMCPLFLNHIQAGLQRNVSAKCELMINNSLVVNGHTCICKPACSSFACSPQRLAVPGSTLRGCKACVSIWQMRAFNSAFFFLVELGPGMHQMGHGLHCTFPATSGSPRPPYK
jgi:hypothetical protein